MQRWKSSVLLFLCVSGLLIGCVALYLHGERAQTPHQEKEDDLPLHPSQHQSLNNLNSYPTQQPIHPHSHDHHYVHRHDALKGVFRSHFKTPRPSEKNAESTENNSSRLKRQLDFGSDEDEKEKTSTPNTKVPSTNQPVLKVLKIGSVVLPSSSPLSTSARSTAKSEGESEGGKFRKGIRRFRPSFKSTSDEKYEIPQKERKNFTLEVVQVERKVVHSQDSHLPHRLFAKSSLIAEPRATTEKNRPSVKYKKGSGVGSETSKSFRPQSRSSEISREVSSVESDYDNKGEDNNSKEKKVVINLNQQIPYNDQDISDEDLKDYNDGHSTFGTKGNFTHTIISRNIAGFLPNNQPQQENQGGLRKRKSDAFSSPTIRRRENERKIVIEKGKVTEKYPSSKSPFEDPSSDIYSVPGGRSNEEENEAPKQQVFHFSRGSGNIPRGGKKANDLTSPAIPDSLEDLYRKGHPGVLPPPRKKSNKRDPPSEEPFEDFQNHFRANPLLDDPPLKFDPESDRFYGEPIPDSKEKIAQSNSPIRAEDRKDDSSSEIEYQDRADYFSPRPLKRGRSTEEDTSAEPSPRNNLRFDNGRAYNPPEYGGNDYDTEQGDNTNNDPEYDFVGLDDNFGSGAADDDYYDYGGRGNSKLSKGSPDNDSNYRSRSSNRETNRGDNKDVSDEGADRENTQKEEQEPTNRRPPSSRKASRGNGEIEFDSAGREAREGAYGFGPEGNDSPTDETYDSGFINTLQQFDEEIRKLQQQERHKLLTTPQQSPKPPAEDQVENSVGRNSNSGYTKERPLIITSPGPPVPLYNPETTARNHDISSTLRVTDDDEISHSDPDPQQPPPVSTESSQNTSNGDDEERYTERSQDYDDSGSGSTEQTAKPRQSNDEGESASVEDENVRRKRFKLYDDIK